MNSAQYGDATAIAELVVVVCGEKQNPPAGKSDLITCTVHDYDGYLSILI